MERVDYESIIIQDLLGHYERHELNLSPWYQRRSVWSNAQKSYLINTIHGRKPVPSIYIRHSVDLRTEKSLREIVDGQQRVRCVIDYRKDKFAARHANHKALVRYSDLSPVERLRFLESALSVGYLIGASDADVIEIFARINSVSKTLNPQEKRNAKYSGEFKQFCLEEAISRLPFWRRNQIFTDSQIARMLELQFVSDLVLNLSEGLQDFNSKRLSDYYALYDDEFPKATEIKQRLDAVFGILVNLPDGLLRRTIFSVPQLLFSLILVMEAVPQVRCAAVEDCITELDARVESVRSGENLEALKRDVYEGFTSGNLHRIRSRRLRDEQIRRYLI